jgi:hypothetical protein
MTILEGCAFVAILDKTACDNKTLSGYPGAGIFSVASFSSTSRLQFRRPLASQNGRESAFVDVPGEEELDEVLTNPTRRTKFAAPVPACDG